MSEALFNASKDKTLRAQTTNPLVQDGLKLIPSVTRVFSKAKEMFVYLQAYQQGVEVAQPMLAFVTFFQGGVKVFESAPISVSEASTNRLKTLPMKFSLPLEKLDAGEYLCQVTVLDAKAVKAAFWQSPIMLVP